MLTKMMAIAGCRVLLGMAGLVLGISLNEAEAQQNVPPLKIGVLTDMSSLYADLTGPGSVAAAKMAVEDFLSAPHRMTRPIEVVSADHMNKADNGAAITREWIERQGVDVIVDAPNSAVALAVRNVVQQLNRVLLVSGAASSDLTGKQCSPNLIHWTYDSYSHATGEAKAVVEEGGKTWFLLAVDLSFGTVMQNDISSALQAAGGSVVGGVRTPINSQDFSSFLLQAQSSKAQVIGLLSAGGDTINELKQAGEFGLAAGGQRIVATLFSITDAHSLGLETAQGLLFTEAFYWDMNGGTRAWSKRFAPRNNGHYPTAIQAGVYSAVTHYLKSVDQIGESSDGKKVVDEMKEMPTDDPLFGHGSVRADGRKIHDMYLFEIKKPSESKYPWDYYKLIKTIPAAEAWRPLKDGGCDFVKSN